MNQEMESRKEKGLPYIGDDGLIHFNWPHPAIIPIGEKKGYWRNNKTGAISFEEPESSDPAESDMECSEMTDEMKLLIAMCDAMGFKAERTVDHREKEVPEEEAVQILRLITSIGSRTEVRPNVMFIMDAGKYRRGDNKSYFTQLVEPIIDYKLTKNGS